MINDDLLKRMNNVLEECTLILTELKHDDKLNEQKTLDWLDALNEFSVRY